MVVVSCLACLYYNTVLSWIIYYLINSFQADLPWASCGHWWNTINCTDTLGVSAMSKWKFSSWPISDLNLNLSIVDDNVLLPWNSSAGPPSVSGNDSNALSWFTMEHLNSLGLDNSTSLGNVSGLTNDSLLFLCQSQNLSSLCFVTKRSSDEFVSSGEEFWK